MVSAFSCRRTDILPSDLSGLLLPIFHHLHSQEIDLECLFLIAQKRRKKSINEMNLKVRNPYIRKNYSVCTDLLFRMYGNIIPYVRIYFPVCTELCTESLFRTYGNIIPYIRKYCFRTYGIIIPYVRKYCFCMYGKIIPYERKY